MLLEEKKENYLINAVIAFFVILFVQWVAPKAIPFKTFEFWFNNISIWKVIKSSWLLFAWGIGVNVVYGLFTKNDPEINRNAEQLLSSGFLISAKAGICEEIAFRWLFFLNAIWGIKLSNWLFFDWLGFGIPEWFYTKITVPIVNFLTLDKIESILEHPHGWFVGAAIIAANAKFRDGHKYQGWFGYVNSWFIGIYLFWLMFQYGLGICIAIHFLYDMVIFIVRYIDAASERAKGLC